MGTDRAGGDSTPRAGDGGPYRKTPTQLATDPAFTATYARLDSAGINVKAYGAKGDGATDDTAAIQAALNAVPVAGGVVVFPAGVYKVPNGGLTCSRTVRLQGVPGLDGTGSRISVDADGVTALTLSAPASVLDTLTIARSSYGTRSAALIGVLMTNANLATITGCVIDGFSTNVKITGGVYYQINRSWIRGFASVGLDVSNAANGDAGDMSVLGCTFDHGGDTTAVGGTGILWHSGGGLRVENTKFLGGSNGLTDCLNLTVANNNNTGVLVVVGNSFEAYTGCGVTVTSPGTGLFGSSLLISGNEFAGYLGSGYGIFLNLPCQGVSITGNTIHGLNYGIDVDQVLRCSIVGNALNGIATQGIRVRSNAVNVLVGPHPDTRTGRTDHILFDSAASMAGYTIPDAVLTYTALRTTGVLENTDGQGTTSVVSQVLARFGYGSGVGYWLLQNSGNPTTSRVWQGYNSSGTKTLQFDPGGFQGAVQVLSGSLMVADSTKGFIMKDSAGHYWRFIVNTSGVLTSTDLGASTPSS